MIYIKSADFTLENSLFGVAELAGNIDFDKYLFTGYGIGFDTCGSFLLSESSGSGKNVVSAYWC